MAKQPLMSTLKRRLTVSRVPMTFVGLVSMLVVDVLGVPIDAAEADPAEEILLEAEGFENPGGWKLDTQFVMQMHSPYLIAHGLGEPVEDATTSFAIRSAGTFRVWVRDCDWVAKFDAGPPPGTFVVSIDGQPLEELGGDSGASWSWRSLGEVSLEVGEHEVAVRDQTGFDGRFDAIYLTEDLDREPPTEQRILSDWRRKLLDLPAEPPVRDGYDLVVVGGGYAGMASSLAAARLGLKVALIQNREVLGGNGSSEVRVWSMGLIRRGKYPRVGEIVEEFADKATKSPGTYEEFGDALKERIIRDKPIIDLFLGHHVYDVRMNPDDPAAIGSVVAIDVRRGESVEFAGTLFADCTGHGTVGSLAGADADMTAKGRMGMSNMWAWEETGEPKSFPNTPWALDLSMADFPYPRDHHGQWFWESGFDKDPIGGAERIRDWNLRAVFGAFNAMKNGDGAEDHRDANLTWVAYIGGPRESRRLLGDVILTGDDITQKRDFVDGIVPSTWSIDLHYPKEQYAEKFPDNPFISKAVHDRSVDRTYGYPVPYRCFYSRNINNLFMAGRCISVTHEALGTVRVMKTCGMMGEVVGKAATVCVEEECSPRRVYQDHLDKLIAYVELPGKARRASLDDSITVPDDALPRASAEGPMSGLDPQALSRRFRGLVVDDVDAKLVGRWTKADPGGKRNVVGYGYRYASPTASPAPSATFDLVPKRDGTYELSLYNYAHPNRGAEVPIEVVTASKTRSFVVDQRDQRDDGTVPVTTLTLQKDESITVVIGSEGAGGVVHIDAVRLAAIED